MTLYELIYEATKNQNSAAVWELILRFEPVINKYSYDPQLRTINEDLKSEMQEILFHRIRNNFKIEE